MCLFVVVVFCIHIWTCPINRSNNLSFPFRDERKQEELWTKTMEFLKEQLTEEEILGLEGTNGDTSKG